MEANAGRLVMPLLTFADLSAQLVLGTTCDSFLLGVKEKEMLLYITWNKLIYASRLLHDRPPNMFMVR